jgi:hypothetical protein
VAAKTIMEMKNTNENPAKIQPPGPCWLRAGGGPLGEADRVCSSDRSACIMASWLRRAAMRWSAALVACAWLLVGEVSGRLGVGLVMLDSPSERAHRTTRASH